MTENSLRPDPLETLKRYLSEITEFTSAMWEQRQETANTIMNWLHQGCTNTLEVYLGTVKIICNKSKDVPGEAVITLFDRDKLDIKI